MNFVVFALLICRALILAKEIFSLKVPYISDCFDHLPGESLAQRMKITMINAELDTEMEWELVDYITEQIEI